MSKKTSAVPEEKREQINLPIGRRDATIDAATLNKEERTFEVVWTKGSDVKRSNWYGDVWIEQLEVSDKAVRLDRLNSGRAAVLDSHNSYSLESVIGVVQKAWLKGDEGRATIRLSSREDIAGIVSDIEDGIIANISCGYIVHAMVEETREGVKYRRATDWEPVEISFVPVPADPDAGMRSAPQGAVFPCIINRAAPENEETRMSKTATTAAGEQPAANTPIDPPAVSETRNQPTQPANTAQAPAAQQATETRAHSWTAEDMTKIQARATAFGLDAKDAIEVMADANVRSVDGATDALQTRAAKKNPPRQTPQTQVVRDEGDTIRTAVQSAVILRANPQGLKADAPEREMARNYRGMTLLEMARAYIEDTQGVRLRDINRRELATIALGLEKRGGMLSTSDFPNLLANVVSKRLRDAYLAAPQNWKLISRQSNNPDFKAKSVVQLSNMPKMKKVLEGGEYQYVKLSEGAESYALATYGNIIAITRQTLINDDLGAFDRIPSLQGRAAAETEASIFWALFTANSGTGATMADGFNLFDSTNHANYTSSGTDISVTSLDVGRQAMRTQTGFGAEAEPLNLSPKFLLVSPAKETKAQQFIASITAAKGSDVNPFANSLTQITEARLSGNGWYLTADPAEIDTIEYAHLEGEEGLYTEQRIGFEVDGIEVKCRDDFAAHVIDYRGFYKNAGA